MKVFVKKLNDNAVVPKYAHITDAGCDMVAVSKTETDNYIEYGTGLVFQISPFESSDWYFEIFPRSSLSNYDLILSNSVGVIDNSYRGEVKFRFKKHKDMLKEIKRFINGLKEIKSGRLCYENIQFIKDFWMLIEESWKYISTYDFSEYKMYEVGDKIGQMILKKRPEIEFEVVDELCETERNDGGYGSSGN